jgi:alpha-1,6-mannosyltransferase
MANETFGISVIEAQASGLPVVGVAAGAMIDRVTPDIGRIGPTGDAAAMARNICDVWAGDHAAMAEASCRHAQQFCWSNSMEALFGTLYPRAIATAARRARAMANAAGAARIAVADEPRGRALRPD